MKTWLLLLALALLAGLVVLASRPDAPAAPKSPDTAGHAATSHGPSFEVHLYPPRTGLPLFGILPDWFVIRLDGTPRALGFGPATPGATIGTVAPDHLELRAGSWDLTLQTDRQGRIAPGTHLVFPLALGGRHLTLRCLPKGRAAGYLRTTPRPGTGDLDGTFRVKLATCEDAISGETPHWPPDPLTVQGSFTGLGRGGR
jgi:hypothetical protein